MGLGSALFGKKYKNTSSYDYVTPDFSYYEQNIPAIYQQAATAPEVNLNINSYTPYGKIQDVRDTGKGYNEYDLREVLDPTYTYGSKSYTGDESWKNDIYGDIATGKVTGITDLASDWTRLQDMIRLGHMTETENLSDEVTKGYYTPYEMALGKLGQGSDIGFDPSRSMVGVKEGQSNLDKTQFDYSGETKSVGKRHKETHYFDPNWSAMSRYDLENTGPLLKASMDVMPTLQDSEGWDWEDNELYDPNYGFFTQEAGDQVYDYDRQQDSKTQKYRKGGVAGALGSVLSFVPGLQPIGMALSAANAAVNGNVLGALASFIPATGVVGKLGSAIGGATGITNSAIQAGLANGLISGGLAGVQGGDIGKAMLGGGLSAGIGSALGGTQYVSGAGSQYINPAISRLLTSGSVSALMGGDAKEAMKNSLLKSAWSTGGKVIGNQFKG
jgi:hypothetical protein